MLAVLVILPLGALVSFTGAIYRTVRLAEREAWPKWLPQSMPILFLLALVLVAVTDVIIIGLGEVFGFYGILAMWLVLWAAVHLFFNYLIARRSNYKVE